MGTRSWVGGLALMATLLGTTAQAALVGYTDRSAFNTAVAALPNVGTSMLNFDSLTAGTLIASGTGAGGITFTYDFGGVSLRVEDGAPTISSPNFLGTDDAGVMQQGDNFQMDFGGANAIGLYVMSLDELIDDDFRLTVGGTSVGLSIASLQQTLSDETQVYFLGMVDAASTFMSASLGTDQNGTGQFLWNADDIVTAAAGTVPEPGTLALAGASLAALVAVGRRTRPQGR